MKKVYLVLGFLIATVFSTNGQEIRDNAIGLRFGGGDGLGAEVSYQKLLGSNNRLEVDLGLGNDFADFKATGLYQWVWNLENKINWYAGAGAGLINTSDVGIYAAGVVGIEYNFDAPVIISLDYRPEVGITGDLNGLGTDISLAVRYQF